MPNHIHLILHFSDAAIRSDLMRDFKKYTSTHIRKEIEQHQPELLQAIEYRHKDGRAFKVWMDRFDEVYLESRHVLETKLEYIHLNPLQSHWNLVARPEDYSYSSACFYETGKQGVLEVSHYMDFV